MISKTLGPWIRVNWKPKMFLSLFSVKVFLQFKDVWYETQSSSPIIQFILTITIDYNDEKLVLSILNNLPSSDFFPRLVSFSDFFSDCKWNIIWFARDHLYEFVFSSPEPKAQVSFFITICPLLVVVVGVVVVDVVFVLKFSHFHLVQKQ